MKKLIFIILVGFLSGLIFTPVAFAAVRCEQQYGGEVCVKVGELQVNKQVFNPNTQQFVDNLDVTDHKFAAGQEILFKIKVKNVGDATLEKITVHDSLPFFLRLSSGSLDFDLFDLIPGETEEREIRARVIEEGSFPQSQTVICDVNVVEAQAKEMSAKDTAKVCAAKEVVKVTVLPPTGFSGFPVLLVLSLLTAVAGIALVFLGRR